MCFNHTKIIFGIFLVLVVLVPASVSQAAAQDIPALVAKPYPGAVPEHMKDGKPVRCGDNEEAYCFLTRDPVEKVKAFYAQQGVKLQTLATRERKAEVGWLSNFYQDLRLELDVSPGDLLAVPLEYYQTTGADDVPSYFNAVVVMNREKQAPLKADEKGRQAVIDNEVLGLFALSPISQIMVPLYGNIYMEPFRLVPHYNRHLGMLSGYFRKVDDNSAANYKYVELHPTWAMPAGASGGNEMDDKEEALRVELKEILSRKPEKKNQYQSLKRNIHNKESRQRIQPELDKILMSDPELAAWKKRSDALAKQASAAESAQINRTVSEEDVEAFLQALEKEVYYTRILIHMSEGRRVTRDAATIKREWRY